MTHLEFKPHAFITLSNCGGIEIMLNRSNDGLYYRFNYGQDIEKERIYDAEILFNNDGEAYFQRIETDTRREYYLSEAMRIN